jgi:hypothetical protein
VFRFSGDRPFDLVVSLNGSGPIATIETHSAPTADTAYVTPRYHLNAATGVPDFVVFEPAGLLLPEASSGSPTNVALAFFAQYPEMFGTGDFSTQLQVRDVIVDSLPSPMTHVVLEQHIGPYRVWGCELRMHLTPGLAIRSISGTYFRDPEVPLDPQVDQPTALAAAIETFYASGGTADALRRSPVEYGGLVILPTGLARDGQGVNHLAWLFRCPMPNLSSPPHRANLSTESYAHKTSVSYGTPTTSPQRKSGAGGLTISKPGSGTCHTTGPQRWICVMASSRCRTPTSMRKRSQLTPWSERSSRGGGGRWGVMAGTALAARPSRMWTSTSTT